MNVFEFWTTWVSSVSTTTNDGGFLLPFLKSVFRFEILSNELNFDLDLTSPEKFNIDSFRPISLNDDKVGARALYVKLSKMNFGKRNLG